jgi:hypothetical protein
MKKPLLHSALALALSATGVLALPSSADANVRNTTGGASCQWSAGSSRAADVVYYTHGTTFIVPGDNRMAFALTCPVTRNLPLSTEGYSDLEVRFRAAAEQVGTVPVDCTATTYRSDGSIASSKALSVNVQGTSYNSNGSLNRPMAVMDFAGALNVTGSKGMTSLQCLLPMQMEIHSIYSSEHDGIDGN